MKPLHPLHCLVAATHTPFHPDGSVNLAVVEPQAAHLLKNGISTVFVNGSTAESSSLSVEERLALAQRWSQVNQGTEMKIVIHFCLDKFMKLHSISIKEYNLRKQQHPAVVYR